jgi:hypothetical protein
MKIKTAILSRYNEQATANNPDVDLLFDVVSSYIIEQNWIYDGRAKQQNIWSKKEQHHLRVNCFILTDLFILLSKKIGALPEYCYRLEIPHFVGNERNPDIIGNYIPFSSELSMNDDGEGRSIKKYKYKG